MKINKFEDFEIWKLSMVITKIIYDYTFKKELSRDFCLRDQMRRAVISISSNIVEGFERNNNNEFIRFLKISKGSAGELRNQLYITLAVGYTNQEEFDSVCKKLEELSKQIGGFIYYLSKKKKEFAAKNQSAKSA